MSRKEPGSQPRCRIPGSSEMKNKIKIEYLHVFFLVRIQFYKHRRVNQSIFLLSDWHNKN